MPCLIRRAAIATACGADPTTYSISDLAAGPLDSKGAEGEHVRSFQMMARRLAGRPKLARVLVHKSGPLSDYHDEDIAQYAEVFRRGIEEVYTVVERAVVRPT